MTSNTPEIYVLIVYASPAVSSDVMAQLSATRYPSVPAMCDAVEQALGDFAGNDWKYYSTDGFRDKWNASTVWNGEITSVETYIAFLEVEHDG